MTRKQPSKKGMNVQNNGWTIDGPTPYFGDDNQFYVIKNESGSDSVTVLVGATPLGKHLDAVAAQVFAAIKQIRIFDGRSMAVKKFKKGDFVYWNDPDANACSGWFTVDQVGVDGLLVLRNADGSVIEAWPHECQKAEQ